MIAKIRGIQMSLGGTIQYYKEKALKYEKLAEKYKKYKLTQRKYLHYLQKAINYKQRAEWLEELLSLREKMECGAIRGCSNCIYNYRNPDDFPCSQCNNYCHWKLDDEDPYMYELK